MPKVLAQDGSLVTQITGNAFHLIDAAGYFNGFIDAASILHNPAQDNLPVKNFHSHAGGAEFFVQKNGAVDVRGNGGVFHFILGCAGKPVGNDVGDSWRFAGRVNGIVLKVFAGVTHYKNRGVKTHDSHIAGLFGVFIMQGRNNIGPCRIVAIQPRGVIGGGACVKDGAAAEKEE